MLKSFILTAVVTVACCIGITNDCDAQLARAWSQRSRVLRSIPHQSNATTSHQTARVRSATSHQPHRFPTESYYQNRNPLVSRILDGKMTHQYRDPAEVDSRYIGGFHQSHFNNIGIPSGDIGIRGNAYNWRTTP